MNVQPSATLTSPSFRIGIDETHDSIDQERQELSWLAERSLIMHKLSKEFFTFRAFWFQFLPLLTITTVTTIIGFLTTGMTMEGSADPLQTLKGVSDDKFALQQRMLSLTVGILGALSTFLTSISKYNHYEARQHMHTMAEKGLQNIGPSLMLGERGMHEDVKKQKVIYIAIVDANTSEVPPKIVQAFNDLDDIMRTKECDFQIMHRRFYNILWKKFTGCSIGGGRIPLWPLVIADINIHKGDIGKLIDVEYEKFKKSRSSRNDISITRQAVLPSQSTMETAAPVVGDSTTKEVDIQVNRGDVEEGEIW